MKKYIFLYVTLTAGIGHATVGLFRQPYNKSKVFVKEEGKKYISYRDENLGLVIFPAALISV